MIEQNPVSSFSFIAGSLSLPAVLASNYLRLNCGQASSCVLNWLDAHGLVRMAPVDRIPEWQAESFWAINDDVAAYRLLASGIVWAAAAMVAALIADHRDESSQHLALGLIFGALALTLHNPVVGLLSMLTGGVVLSILRSHRA